MGSNAQPMVHQSRWSRVFRPGIFGEQRVRRGLLDVPAKLRLESTKRFLHFIEQFRVFIVIWRKQCFRKFWFKRQQCFRQCFRQRFEFQRLRVRNGRHRRFVQRRLAHRHLWFCCWMLLMPNPGDVFTYPDCGLPCCGSSSSSSGPCTQPCAQTTFTLVVSNVVNVPCKNCTNLNGTWTLQWLNDSQYTGGCCLYVSTTTTTIGPGSTSPFGGCPTITDPVIYGWYLSVLLVAGVYNWILGYGSTGTRPPMNCDITEDQAFIATSTTCDPSGLVFIFYASGVQYCSGGSNAVLS